MNGIEGACLVASLAGLCFMIGGLSPPLPTEGPPCGG